MFDKRTWHEFLNQSELDRPKAPSTQIRFYNGESFRMVGFMLTSDNYTLYKWKLSKTFPNVDFSENEDLSVFTRSRVKTFKNKISSTL